MQKQTARPQQVRLVIGILRLAGAFFILAGLIVGFDMGGIASRTGMTNSGMQALVGGALALVGLSDFFLVPLFLKKTNPGHDKAL